jgi:hydrogenase expression/formation protein HypE
MPGPDAFVTLGHGSGGRLTRDLVRDLFVSRFSNPVLDGMSDSAVLDPGPGRLAFTTDGFVVSPLFFAGGDIGRLAVDGTVNDLAVAGAVPLYLSASFLIEEGFPFADLARVADSMAAAAREAGVLVVTGDTKVVERGHGDGVFVVTAGVGRMREPAPEGPSAIRPDDEVLVSGPVGDHGAVIAASRSRFDLPPDFGSDCGPVHRIVAALFDAGIRPRFLRDPTRGGLATVLSELGREAGVTIEVREADLPVREPVRAVCDLLGLDPLYLACEGRVVAVVPQGQGEAARAAMAGVPEGAGARCIGSVLPKEAGPMRLATRFGGRRSYDLLASDPLPRIC